LGGKIIYEERDITHLPTHEKVEMGIVLAPEGQSEKINGSFEIREAYPGIED
jgi:ABC-type branched-subunit amino acid transport system ATPase component